MRRRIEQVCPWCGNTFTAERRDRKRYCSHICANTAINDRLRRNWHGDEELEALLLRHREIDPESGCWLWTGAVKARPGGDYGLVKNCGRQYTVHRLAAHLWLGMNIEDSRFVLHHCDTPRCFNPDHLFIGTHADNMRDMVAKGRSRNYRASVPQGPRAKLSWDDADQIRRRAQDGESPTKLAREFGVSPATVRSIRRGRSWRLRPDGTRIYRDSEPRARGKRLDKDG